MVWKLKSLNKKEEDLVNTFPLSDIISHITVSKTNKSNEVNKLIRECKQATVSQRSWIKYPEVNLIF